LAGDIWVPLNMVAELTPRRSESVLRSRQSVWLVMGARLKPGVPLARAQAELDAIGRALEREFPEENRGRGVRVVAPSPIPGNTAPVAAFMVLLMARSLRAATSPRRIGRTVRWSPLSTRRRRADGGRTSRRSARRSSGRAFERGCQARWTR
jgi:hypothetical protein